MSKGLPRSLKRGSKATQPVIKQIVSLTNKTITVDGATGVGWGTVVLEGLPQGNILLLGAVLNLTLDEGGSANIVDTFDGDAALGTAPATSASLSGAQVDIIPSTAITTAVAGVSTTRIPSTSTQNGTIIDNTAGTAELNLQVLIDDVDIDADDVSVSLSGDLTLSYTILGDD